ncbi:MAG: hypothetical protein GKR89_07450 [Candidatus Latescibacteria bacterium]|nr:hypothetical protein [Candidatus Latescibacterota bacterium]
MNSVVDLRVLAGLVLGLTLANWLGCALLPGGQRQNAELTGAVGELTGAVGELAGSDKMAVLGFRNAKGERDTAAEIIEENLISDLVGAGIPLQLALGDGKKWSTGNAIPERHWQDLESTRVLGGRLHREGAWIYLRLFVVDTQSGAVLLKKTQRMDAADLDRQVALREERRGGGGDQGPVQADMTLLVLRDEGGFPQRVEVAEGGALKTGDRLQLRVTLGTDSQLYAFLYDEDGQVQNLLANQLVYSGRIQYGPGSGEEDWLTLSETDQVYTLYLLAARRLDEDTGELFEKLGALIDEAKVERFTGLNVQDAEVAAYVQRSIGSEEELSIVRGEDLFARGDEESIIFEDGTLVKSAPLQMEGEPALLWAFSFKVE